MQFAQELYLTFTRHHLLHIKVGKRVGNYTEDLTIANQKIMHGKKKM